MAELIYVTGRKNYETVSTTKEQVKDELSRIGLQYNDFSGKKAVNDIWRSRAVTT